MKNHQQAAAFLFLKYLILGIFTCLFIVSCSKDDEDIMEVCSTPIVNDTINEPDPVPTCDTIRPVVMMHGFLASGDTYTNQLLRWESNGACTGRVFVFDWNSLGEDDNVALLDAFIDEILAETNADQVDLAGHSAGGGLGWDYIADEGRVSKIAHYAHLGSFPDQAIPAAASDLEIINIYSTDDTTVAGADINGAENVMLSGYDHYEVATSVETFEAMYEFFTDGAMPENSTINSDSERIINGKVLTLGENQPEVNATVEIYELDSATGFRLQETPDEVFTADDNGHWGPFVAKENTHYEFYAIPADASARTVHYYREPFIRSNPLVYLRTFPPPGGLAGILVGLLPSDDNQSVMANFTSSQAIVSGRDNFSVDGITLSNDALCSADQTTIALFLYDDGDGVTTETPNTIFANFPFLNAADLFFPTEVQSTVEFRFNGRVLNVPTWKSETEGVNVIVFD